MGIVYGICATDHDDEEENIVLNLSDRAPFTMQLDPVTDPRSPRPKPYALESQIYPYDCKNASLSICTYRY